MLNFLKYASNRMTDEQAAQVLEAAQVRFRVGADWLDVRDGQLISGNGDTISAGIGAVTGISIGGVDRTANGVQPTAGLQPVVDGPGSAGYIPPEPTEQGRQLSDTGTGETVRVTVDPNDSNVRRSTEAPPTEAAVPKANSLQPVTTGDGPLTDNPEPALENTGSENTESPVDPNSTNPLDIAARSAGK